MKTMKANFIFGKKQIVLASLVLILGAAVYLNWQFASSNEDLTLANASADSANNPSDVVITGGEELLSDETGLPLDSVLDTTEKEQPILTGTDEKSTGADIAKTNAAIDEEADGVKTSTEQSDETAASDKTKNLGDALFVSAKTISNEDYFTMAMLARTKARDEVTETIATVLNDDAISLEDKKDVSAKALALTDVIESENRIENLIKAKGYAECVVYLTENHANIVVKTPGLDQDQATQIKNIVVSEGNIKGEGISITEIN